MIPPEQLNKWQQLADAATEGPWECFRNPNKGFRHYWHVRSSASDEDILDINAEKEDLADLDFIAAAREAVPALIAEVKRLRDIIHRLEYPAKETKELTWTYTREPND
jgi:hypothetical protein